MLPILGKPVIHYVVEEAVAAGVREILIVTSRGKGAIDDYFDRHTELETHLEARSDRETLEKLRDLTEMADVHTVRQKRVRGLGDAVAAARAFVGDEPFAVLLADTLIEAQTPALQQLLEVFAARSRAVVGLTEVSPSQTTRYGIASGGEIAPGILDVEQLIEKPVAGAAPSNLAIAGRYIFTPEIFPCIAESHLDHSGELQLTDAMELFRQRTQLLGVTMKGSVYDVGDRAGFLRANLHYAMQDPELRLELQRFWQSH